MPGTLLEHSSSTNLHVQVQLYFPQIGHPAYGIVRAIVKDSTDFYQGLSSVTFLDSDGKVSWLRGSPDCQVPIQALLCLAPFLQVKPARSTGVSPACPNGTWWLTSGNLKRAGQHQDG